MISAEMASKRADSKRENHLGIRLSDAEAKRLAEVSKLFPELPKSALVRFALMAGLAVVEREGIKVPPKAKK